MREDVLKHLHDGHLGVNKTKLLASESCWWPGISRDIEQIVRNCNKCQEHRRDRVEPMMSTEFPGRPWSRIGADFFQFGNHMYLLTVDYYSRDFEIANVNMNIDSAKTITQFKKVFSRHGVCDVLFTDNAPVFSSTEFAAFCKTWQFRRITSSPKYAQSNGASERCVQTLKQLLKKSDDIFLAILNYRSTPLQNGYSPAQLSMGRRLKTLVPCHSNQLVPKTIDSGTLQERERMYRKKMTKNYNYRHRVVASDDFQIGDQVYIPDSNRKGIIKDFMAVLDHLSLRPNMER